ncbi:sugar phosphate isomerase/epimerase family protein [Kitasatospora sp. LaBMicrA B282]|uniref:sugar phosphate isomerase/epimerase family protein n=1 Tax=Kitasatospora sp. LaBMicrA B282 TaxID=3420949 RepID=UPI003D0FE720
MRTAFSTLGLPGRPLGEALRLAAEHGWQGLELRCAPGEPVHPGLSADERRRVVREFAAAGITPLTVASYLGIAAPGSDGPLVSALREQLRLAADLGAAHVRVFPRGGPGPTDAAELRAARRLAGVAEEARELGVRILLETHDSHRGGRDVARLLRLVAHPAVGALWDLMHTHSAGESPTESYAALAAHLGYVQVKDIAGAHDRTPLPLGAGVLPIADCVRLLPADGWVSWEYEAAWYPDAAPLPPMLGAAADFLARLT